ncbi:MAG: hypothetical protein Q4G45_04230, partial [Actinomycetia bacterium]|nr:hypothetical protein [Actinomycetes bacterium]
VHQVISPSPLTGRVAVVTRARAKSSSLVEDTYLASAKPATHGWLWVPALGAWFALSALLAHRIGRRLLAAKSRSG